MGLIDEIVRKGARWMLAEALQAEVDAYIAGHVGERDAHGRRLVVRNGYEGEADRMNLPDQEAQHPRRPAALHARRTPRRCRSSSA